MHKKLLFYLFLQVCCRSQKRSTSVEVPKWIERSKGLKLKW